MADAKTQDWLDLYSMTLESLAKFLDNPTERFRHLGIDPKVEGSVPIPPKMTMEKYHELMQSWGRVRMQIRAFGLDVSEDLMLAPIILMPRPAPPKGAALVALNDQLARWQKSPWLEVSRPLDVVPVRFEGRDAFTAFNFFNFFIQQCESLDPGKKVRQALLAQGINGDNFEQHAGKMLIRNPFDKKK